MSSHVRTVRRWCAQSISRQVSRLRDSGREVGDHTKGSARYRAQLFEGLHERAGLDRTDDVCRLLPECKLLTTGLPERSGRGVIESALARRTEMFAHSEPDLMDLPAACAAGCAGQDVLSTATTRRHLVTGELLLRTNDGYIDMNAVRPESWRPSICLADHRYLAKATYARLAPMIKRFLESSGSFGSISEHFCSGVSSACSLARPISLLASQQESPESLLPGSHGRSPRRRGDIQRGKSLLLVTVADISTASPAHYLPGAKRTVSIATTRKVDALDLTRFCQAVCRCSPTAVRAVRLPPVEAGEESRPCERKPWNMVMVSSPRRSSNRRRYPATRWFRAGRSLRASGSLRPSLFSQAVRRSTSADLRSRPTAHIG